MTKAMIEVEDLEKDYGAVRALRGVTFSIPRGQVVGLLGPNGAGKTTAMRILTGFVAPTGGSARVGGFDVLEDPMGARRQIGYLPEGNPLYLELRVEESLRFCAQMYGIPSKEVSRAVASALRSASLVGLERRVIGTFSKGYRQRVGLAQALLHEPDVLILDEPSSGLDPNQQVEMRELIRRLGEERTVVFSTHILPEVEAVCDRALIVSRGQIVADGTVPQIQAMGGGHGTVEVVVRGPQDALTAALAPVAFLDEVSVTDTPGEEGYARAGAVATRVPTSSELASVAEALKAAGLPLVRLEARAPSLADVFLELTEVPPDLAASDDPVAEGLEAVAEHAEAQTTPESGADR